MKSKTLICFIATVYFLGWRSIPTSAKCLDPKKCVVPYKMLKMGKLKSPCGIKCAVPKPLPVPIPIPKPTFDKFVKIPKVIPAPAPAPKPAPIPIPTFEKFAKIPKLFPKPAPAPKPAPIPIPTFEKFAKIPKLFPKPAPEPAPKPDFDKFALKKSVVPFKLAELGKIASMFFKPTTTTPKPPPPFDFCGFKKSLLTGKFGKFKEIASLFYGKIPKTRPAPQPKKKMVLKKPIDLTQFVTLFNLGSLFREKSPAIKPSTGPGPKKFAFDKPVDLGMLPVLGGLLDPAEKFDVQGFREWAKDPSNVDAFVDVWIRPILPVLNEFFGPDAIARAARFGELLGENYGEILTALDGTSP